MKSKYFDINKFTDRLDPTSHDKYSRKHTKPKNNLKMYLPNPPETDSDFRPEDYSKNTKKLTIPHKKPHKQISKSQKPSPKKFNPIKFNQSSDNNQVYSNKPSIDSSKRQKSQKQSRLLTDSPNQTNFIGQLDNYLKQLKRSKLYLIQNEEAVENETLLINKMNLINQQKSLDNTLQKSNRWQNKIKKEKSINRNLQKCIIEIQKVLWDRNDKLEMLQDEIRKENRNKENISRKNNEKDRHNLSKTIFFNKDYARKTQPLQKKGKKNIIFHQKQDPLNHLSKISSRERKIQGLYETYSDTQKQSETSFKEGFGRRKTQNSINIEKMIQNRLRDKGINRTKKDKTYSRFQRQQLNQV